MFVENIIRLLLKIKSINGGVSRTSLQTHLFEKTFMAAKELCLRLSREGKNENREIIYLSRYIRNPFGEADRKVWDTRGGARTH